MKITIILTFAVLFLSLNLNGQNRIVSGRVIDEDFEPLPMLDIQYSDTVNLGRTDMDGRFSISISQEIDRLLFCYVGMEWADIRLQKDCDTVEIVMMYAGTYDFMTLKKVDRLRRKRFDNLSNLHSIAVKNGLFQNGNICYERIFEKYNPPKPVLDSIKRESKLKRKQNKDTFKELAIGDIIRIPYYGTPRYDGTNRTNLNSYSYAYNRKDFDCFIIGEIISKNKQKGAYNIVYRVIDWKDCNYDNMVLYGKELKVGETIEYNMKYSKIFK